MENRNLSFNLVTKGNDAASRILSEAIKRYPDFAQHFHKADGDASLKIHGQAKCVTQTLILFFLTGKYQGEHEKPCDCESGFDHAVKVYKFSVDYDLDELAKLAAKQFPELGKSKTFADIVRNDIYLHAILNQNECLVELANYVGERALNIEERDQEQNRHLNLYDEDSVFTVVDSLLRTILLQRAQIQDLLAQVDEDEEE